MNDPSVKRVVHYIAIDLSEVWVWQGLSRLEWFLARQGFRLDPE